MTPLLSGIRVVDLTSVIMGPFATQQLGCLGAEIIKIEPPGGEPVRHIAPMRNPAMGAMFLNVNRNKRSVVLDLKTAEGRAAFDRIVATADVVVHNIRREPAARLGIDAARLCAMFPKLVHCTALGFSRGGEYEKDAAYDDVVQALSGFASTNADANGPRYLPQIAVDKISGLFIVEGVLAALLHRERTGKGSAFEVPMQDCAAHFLLTEHLAGHVFRPPMGDPGYARLVNQWRKPYRTADGWVAVLPYIDKHWRGMLPLIGRADLASEPWINSPTERSQRVDELYRMIAEAMPQRTTAEWLEAFREADIPCGRVHTLDSLFEDPHLAATGFFEDGDHPSEGPIRTPRHPLVFDSMEAVPDNPAPGLGADTRAVLAEAGLTADEIDTLAPAEKASA